MKLKPWYQTAPPREDLRKNQALDASEFAVHLAQAGPAPHELTGVPSILDHAQAKAVLQARVAVLVRRPEVRRHHRARPGARRAPAPDPPGERSPGNSGV
jgi:hypothetical protein